MVVKMSKVDIYPCFKGIITSQDIGVPKEKAAFWSGVGERIGFHRESTLCADDTEAVLAAARAYGITHLIHISRYSTACEPEPSERFPSIEGFHEIMP